MKKSESSQRLRQFLKAGGIDQKELVAKVKSVPADALLKALRGDTVTWVIALAIQEVFPKCNPVWLVTGTGDMVIKSKSPMTINERIKDIRISMGLKASEMARLIGRVRSTYSQLENGQVNATLDYVKSIKEVSGLPYAYIIDGESREYASKECMARLEKVEEENAILKRTLEIFRETTKERLKD